jgi:hypothetical protein
MMNFTQQQYLVIKGLADGIFPRMPDSPSASDLPVPEMFINIAQTWTPAIFSATANALDVINNISVAIFAVPIEQLNEKSLAILTDVIANNVDLKLFWEPFRTLVTLSYYALPPAYEAIGLPGPSIDKGGFMPDGSPSKETSHVCH